MLFSKEESQQATNAYLAAYEAREAAWAKLQKAKEALRSSPSSQVHAEAVSAAVTAYTEAALAYGAALGVSKTIDGNW